MIAGFKNFIMRGNVIELATAVVIGAAFGALVTSLVEGLFNPLLAFLFGEVDLTSVASVPLRENGPGPEDDVVLSFGVVLDALLRFLLVAAAIYFFVVVPVNRLAERRKSGAEPEPEKPAEDVLLLQEIRDLLAERRPL